MRAWILAGLALVCAAGPARAQTPRATFSAGYELLRIPDETFPAGVNADIAVPIDRIWSVMGEIGFAHDNTNPIANSNISLTNFGGGVRVGGVTAGPFVQLVAGGVHTSANLGASGVIVKASDTAFMVQPGVGVAVPVNETIGVVAQGDYRRAFFKQEAENEYRLYLGVRVSFR